MTEMTPREAADVFERRLPNGAGTPSGRVLIDHARSAPTPAESGTILAAWRRICGLVDQVGFLSPESIVDRVAVLVERDHARAPASPVDGEPAVEGGHTRGTGRDHGECVRCDASLPPEGSAPAPVDREALARAFYDAPCLLGVGPDGVSDHWIKPRWPEANGMADVALTALRDAAHPEPEVVTGEEADELPAGSIVVSDYTEHDDSRNGYRRPYVAFPLTKTPEGFRYHRADERPDQLMASRRFRVLYRAPEPPALVALPVVGDLVPDYAAARVLPLGTLIEGGGVRALVKVDVDGDREVEWATGWPPSRRWPARILNLPVASEDGARTTDPTCGAS